MTSEIIIGAIGSILATIIIWIIFNRQNFILSLKSLILNRNQRVRISIHAILKVEKDNKYLLIRNLNRPNSFAPIGGAYKYHSSASSFFDDVQFEPQTGRNKVKDLKRDIRGYLPYKSLLKFIKWFKDERDREINCMIRELKEELEEINKPDIFEALGMPEFRLVRQANDGPHVIEGYDYLQFSLFNVYEFAPDYLENLNAVEILSSAAKKNSNLIFVSREDILKRRTDRGFTIGTHCGFLFGDKRTGPYPAPYKPK